MARGAVGTAIINQDIEHPLKTLERMRQRRAGEEASAAAAQQKQQTEDAKRFQELYEIGGDWFDEYTVPVLAELGQFRGDIYNYQLQGGSPDDPRFQVWYAGEKQRILSMMDKTNYIKDVVDTGMGAVTDDPLRDDTYYSTLYNNYLKQGNPAEASLEELKNIEYDMGGYNGLQAAETFAKNESEDVIQKMRTQTGVDGDLTVIDMSEYASNLFDLDANGRFQLDANGIPKMRITEQTLSRWKADPDRGRYMDEIVSIIEGSGNADAAVRNLQQRFGDRMPYATARRIADLTYEAGAPKYDLQYEEDYSAMQQAILDPLLRPYASRTEDTKYQVRAAPDEDEGDGKAAYDAMLDQVIRNIQRPRGATGEGEVSEDAQRLLRKVVGGRFGGRSIQEAKYSDDGSQIILTVKGDYGGTEDVPVDLTGGGSYQDIFNILQSSPGLKDYINLLVRNQGAAPTFEGLEGAADEL